MVPEEFKRVPLRPHPHVVILGAGASYAATPEGEMNGLKLPLMKQLPEALELRDLLEPKEFAEAVEDFEKFFDSLVMEKRTELCTRIEDRVISYFDSVHISDKVTMYDRIVLALRRKDVIATFNWDPLLPYAYRRNGHLKMLPAILFLHGNTRLGYCQKDKRLGWNDDRCDVCSNALDPVKLLYPVTKKDYSSDPMIAEQWNHLDWFLTNAYFVTIVGYSAPKTDTDARTRIADKLLSNALKGLLQIEIVDPNADRLIETNFKELIKGTHYGSCFPPENSWLFRHPRMTCEALFQATMMMKPIQPYGQPSTENLSELQEWAIEFNSINEKFKEEGQPWQG